MSAYPPFHGSALLLLLLAGLSPTLKAAWSLPEKGAALVVEEGEGNPGYLRLSAVPGQSLVEAHRVEDLPGQASAVKISWKQRILELRKSPQPWHDARLTFQFLDHAGKPLEGSKQLEYRQKVTKDPEWMERSRQFLVPEGATKLEITAALYQVAAGTFDLQAMTLSATDPAEIHAELAKKEEEARKRYVAPEEPMKEKWPPQLRVEGNRLVTPEGKEMWLQGLNAGGLETDPDNEQMIKSALVGVEEWKANAVRLPVKEIFWFGHHARQSDGGEGYRQIVDRIVTLVANRGSYVVLDLHRFRAPKEEHREFWESAAARYANHPAVLFDLFNEPHGISWEVWRDGGFVETKEPGSTDESAFLSEAEKAANNGFQSIGMQALVDTVRATGAKNIIVAGGLEWASDLRGITEGYALTDPGGQGIMYSWHIYNWHKGWEPKVLAAAAKYPILVGEFGADPNKMNFIPHEDQEDPHTWVPDILGFIQMHRLNWTGWCFHPRWTPVMISDWDYTPTPFWGAYAKEALAGKEFEMKRTR